MQASGAEQLPLLHRVVEKLAVKSFNAESPGLRPAIGRLDAVRVALERLDRLDDGGGALLVEEHAGGTLRVEAANRLQRSSLPKRNHRCAGRLGLDQHDAKILARSEQE